MKYRKESGKAVTHTKRMVRQMKARLRASNTRNGGRGHVPLDAATEVRIEEDISELETQMRAPQGGRRHGGLNKSKSR